jgi:AmmeMemoRadiSam system protein A/AmmeMemoRadiSam system protein B
VGLTFAGISPHPPLLVPAIGRDNLEQVTHTRDALQQLSRHVVERRPDTVVFITPHGPVRTDAVSLLLAPAFEASFKSFAWSCELSGNLDLGERLAEEARKSGFPTFRYATFDSYRYYFSRGLDHATMVPLYYLREAGLQSRVIVISIASWSHREHFEFGKALRRAIDSRAESIAIVASGDLSHRLIPTAPAGYEPQGIEFDEKIVRSLGALDVDAVLELDEDFIERIGECGLRPISMLLGATQGLIQHGHVLSYEGPFGVGYCVAELDLTAAADDVAHAEAPGSTQPASPPGDELEGPSLHLVRAAVERYVRDGKLPSVPGDLPALLQRPGAAFVCIKNKRHLRGCIGTTHPTHESLAQELMHNAVGACSRDPRFPPVTPAELGELNYSVDILDEAEPVSSPHELDPRTYGVIVRSGSRSGVLLPDIEGVDDASAQVQIARQKAGIGPHDDYELFRFKVRRFKENNAWA